jgi:CO/xanthine dehydrogenase FAD-binding subunit
MPAAVSHRSLVRPRSLAEALRLLRDEAPASLTPMAGCTDLYVSLNFGTLAGVRFLDLWPLDALRGIGMRDGRLWIGALATHADLIRSPLVRRRVPMLAAAARQIGGVQIQNRGTIGGNAANASPAGDTLPVLAAMDAAVVLDSAAGRRSVPFGAFYTGYRQTVRRPDELIAGFEIPAVKGAQLFRKVGTRAAQAISKVVIAAVFGPDPRVALGSVAPTVVRLPRTEAAIARGAPAADVRTALQDEIAPIDDVRSTAEYRRRVAWNVLARMLSDDARRMR